MDKLDFSIFHSFVELAFPFCAFSFMNSLLYEPSPFTYFKFFLSQIVLCSISRPIITTPAVVMAGFIRSGSHQEGKMSRLQGITAV